MRNKEKSENNSRISESSRNMITFNEISCIFKATN